MSENLQRKNEPQVYSPKKPDILTVYENIQNNSVVKLVSQSKTGEFQIYTTKLDACQMLGLLFHSIDPAKMGEYYGIFENNKALRQVIEAHSQVGDREIGTMYRPCTPDGDDLWDFFVGGIVKDVDEIPEGASLMEFPEMEYLIVTHDWYSSESELMESGIIGRTVGYATSGDQLEIPDGIELYEYYKKYDCPIGYRERWNFNADENRFRMEVWFAIRNNSNTERQ